MYKKAMVFLQFISSAYKPVIKGGGDENGVFAEAFFYRVGGGFQREQFAVLYIAARIKHSLLQLAFPYMHKVCAWTVKEYISSSPRRLAAIIARAARAISEPTQVGAGSVACLITEVRSVRRMETATVRHSIPWRRRREATVPER